MEDSGISEIFTPVTGDPETRLTTVGREPEAFRAIWLAMKPMREAFTGRLLVQLVLDMLQWPVASVAEPAASNRNSSGGGCFGK
jgi:hypothetical protein